MSIPTPVATFYERIWNAGDLEMASDLLTPDFTFRSSLGTEMRGREAFTDYVRSIRSALSDYRCDISECVAEGEQAFAKVIFSGRHVGVFRGYQATGKLVSWVGAALFRFRGDLISSLWVLGDVATLDAALRENQRGFGGRRLAGTRLEDGRQRMNPVAESRVSGSCFCGSVRFSVSLPTLFCGHCHCSMCRRSHGAAFVTWFAVARSQFLLERGDADLVRFRSSNHGTRSFCRRCGSSLFCESTRHPDQVDIVLANMHGAIDRPPQLHIFFDDRADWVSVEDGLPRLGGTTGMEPI